MKQLFTIEQLKQSACSERNKHLFSDTHMSDTGKRNTHKNNHKGSKAKAWLLLNLQYWCNEQAVTLETEYKFHPYRKYRFDYAIPALMIAIEYEGLMSNKSRHTTIKGYSGDTDKYNLAQSLGWKVFRVTAINYKTIIMVLNDYLNNFVQQSK